MLIALNEEQELTLASDVIRESGKCYTCPCCNTAVIFKMGTKTIPHFAHKSLVDCQAASENESIAHMTGKLDIFRQFSKSSATAKLERYFAEINQRADVAVEAKNATFAFEFQCSTISVDLLTQRTAGYKSIGIIPIWVFNNELCKRNKDGSFRINSMIQSAINANATLFFYDIKRKKVSRISEITPFSRTSFFGNEISILLSDLSSNFFTNCKMERMEFYSEWHKKRDRYINGIRYEGLKNNFHLQLYQSGIYIQNLNDFVGIPLRNNFLISTPPIEWQGILFIELLINRSMTKSEIIDLWNCKIDGGEIVPSETAKSNKLDLNNALYEFMAALLYSRFARKCPNDSFSFCDKNYNGVPYEKLVKFLSRN